MDYETHKEIVERLDRIEGRLIPIESGLSRHIRRSALLERSVARQGSFVREARDHLLEVRGAWRVMIGLAKGFAWLVGLGAAALGIVSAGHALGWF